MSLRSRAEGWVQRWTGEPLDRPLGNSIPAPHEVQQGYWVAGEERLLLGRTNRVFGFPYGCREWERSVLGIPPLATTGRILSPLAPLSRDHRLVLWTPPPSRRGRSAIRDDLSMITHPEFPLPERFAIVAASYGCRTALAFAAAHPDRVRALALICPLILPRQIRRISPFLLGLVGLPRLSARMLAPLGYDSVGTRKLPLPATLELLRQARRFEPLDLLRRLAQAWREPLPDLASLRSVPVFVLWGALDPFCDQRTVRSLERSLTVSSECIDDASHLPFLSHPVWVNARLQAFLAEPH